MTLRDIDGDGFVDQLQSTSDGQLHVAHNDTGKTNLLKGVTRPLGTADSRATMAFDYTRDGNTYGMPQSRFVLSRVSVNDGHPGDGADVTATTLSYSGGVYDRAEREFDGYATVVATQVDPTNNEAPLRSVTSSFRTDGHYTRGLLQSRVTVDAAGHKFVQTGNTYTLHDVTTGSDNADPHSPMATIFPQLVRTDQRFFEGQDTAGQDHVHHQRATTRSATSPTPSTPATTARVTTCTRISPTPPPTRPARRATSPVRPTPSTSPAAMARCSATASPHVDCATGNVTQVRAALNGTQAAITDLSYSARRQPADRHRAGEQEQPALPAGLHLRRHRHRQPCHLGRGQLRLPLGQHLRPAVRQRADQHRREQPDHHQQLRLARPAGQRDRPLRSTRAPRHDHLRVPPRRRHALCRHPPRRPAGRQQRQTRHHRHDHLHRRSGADHPDQGRRRRCRPDRPPRRRM